MQWQGERESENVEDRRGMGGGTMVAGGGIGTIVVVLLISAIFGVNPLQLLQQMPQGLPAEIRLSNQGRFRPDKNNS